MPFRTLSNDVKAAMDFVRGYSRGFSNKEMLNFRKYNDAKYRVTLKDIHTLEVLQKEEF